MLNKKLIVIPIIALLVGGFFFFKWYTRKAPETVKVGTQTLTESFSASGKLTSEEVLTLRFATSDKVVYSNTKPGDLVKKGQLLAKLDTTIANSNYQKALSDLRQAEASLEKVYDEVKGHEKDETFTQKEKRTLAETAKDNAYEEVISSQKVLFESSLVSPINGIVLENNISKGQNIGPTDTIKIVNPEKPIFLALIDESDLSKVSSVEKVRLTLDIFPNQTFEAKIQRTIPKTITTSSGSSVIEVELKIENLENFIEGASGDTEFIIEEKETLTISKKAVFEQDGKHFTWLKKGRKFEKKEIVLGVKSGRLVEVTSGLQQGDEIISDASSYGKR